MRTTIILDPHIKKQAQLKALEEGRTLTDVINSMLELYVTGRVDPNYLLKPDKTQSLREKLNKAKIDIETNFDRDFIYDLTE